MVVPHRLRKPLFDQSHSGPLAAHLGAQRTFLQLRTAYYWPGMKGDIVRWTRECETCAQCRGPPTRRRSHTIFLPTNHQTDERQDTAPKDFLSLGSVA